MYQYRQVLARMRRGDSDRDIARSKAMGRKKIAQVREIASERGWLAADSQKRYGHDGFQQELGHFFSFANGRASTQYQRA